MKLETGDIFTLNALYRTLATSVIIYSKHEKQIQIQKLLALIIKLIYKL